jgi:hypothetical protein
MQALDHHCDLLESMVDITKVISEVLCLCTVRYNMFTNSFGPEISPQYVGTLRSSRRCKNDPIWKPKVALQSQKRELYNYDKCVHVHMEKKL